MLFAFESIPIDAYPDVTNIQVQVLTEAPGLSPVEVERFITYPLELQMTGLPGLAEIRSLSKFAFPRSRSCFNDDVDMYFARQLVLERIMAVKERLPEGLEPVMAPVTTGLGEVYHYYVEGPSATLGRAHATATDQLIETELTDQRTMQDWVLRPLLKGVPGVIDVNGMGGFVKQYQVLVDPAKLRKYDLTLHEIYDAVAKNNANAGGNVLERHAERSIVRGLGLIKTVGDIESIIVKEVRRHAGVRARCRGSPHRPCRAPWRRGSQWGAGGRDRDGAHASRRQCSSGGRGGEAPRWRICSRVMSYLQAQD